MRRLIADTKTWLLAVTMLASVLHLLFEFLAFKSDVDFWRKNTSLRGLSVPGGAETWRARRGAHAPPQARSVVVDLLSQIGVLAYITGVE